MATDDRAKSFGELLTAKQAAERLTISARTVFELTRTGQLPVIRIGCNVRYALSDIEAFIASRRSGGN
ncbi:MAG: helix-turn-helix domain-containing protein [Phycisphaera sp.]|jgi:excisionase family DNA binding protein|nr:helix-turn-helix domain-containing protein [Phycisphaera sp.]